MLSDLFKSTPKNTNFATQLVELMNRGEQRETKIEELVLSHVKTGKIDAQEFYQLCKPKPPILYARVPNEKAPHYSLIMFDEEENKTYTICIAQNAASTIGIWNGKIPTPPPFFRITQGATLAQFTNLPTLLFNDATVEDFNQGVKEYEELLSMDYSIAKGEKREVKLRGRFEMAFLDTLDTTGIDAVCNGERIITADNPALKRMKRHLQGRYDSILQNAIADYRTHMRNYAQELQETLDKARANRATNVEKKIAMPEF